LPGDLKTDLMVRFKSEPEQIAGAASFDRNRFKPETRESLINRFLYILDEALKDTGILISEIPFIAPAEREQIIGWNRTARDYARSTSIDRLFEQQVDLTPKALAVCCGSSQITYEELEARANQLARYLIRRSVKPEEVVGLCLDRSLEVVVAMIGALKAGCADLPLDPECPSHRLGYMLRNAGVRVVVSRQSIAAHLPAGSVEVIDIEKQWEEIERESRERVRTIEGGEHLAYVIYTSGSTGEPK